MKSEEFKNIIRTIVREELHKIQPQDITEKSVPQPYDRKKARKMSKSQVELRKKIGQAMMRDEKKVSKFRKKYGDEWKDYLWAAASSAAFRQSGGSKADDKRKK